MAHFCAWDMKQDLQQVSDPGATPGPRARGHVGRGDCEFTYARCWSTNAEARSAIVHWIEAVHNRRRRHSALGMLAPMAYKQQQQVECNAA